MEALILIDVQEGFYSPYWGKRNNPEFEKNAALLLGAARSKQLPIFHVQHLSTEKNSPLRPELPGSRFMSFAEPRPGEPVVQKNVNSAFIGTDLELQLRRENIRSFLILGLTTDHCVSTTTRMAKNLGFEVHLPHDAVATFDRVSFDEKRFDAQSIHEAALASLHGEFATIRSTKETLKILNS